MDLHTEYFLRDLWRYGNASYYWTPQRSKSHWFSTKDTPPTPPNAGEHDVYMGVHPNRFTPARPSWSRSKLKTIAAISCVYCDIDGTHTPPELPLPPTYVVSSGGGLHCYWIVEPLVIDTPSALAQAKHIQREWVRKIPEADQGVCCLTRILRLPGTLNHKYTPARKVEFKSFTPAIEYTLNDLQIPPMPLPSEYRHIQLPEVKAGEEATRLLQHISDTIAHSPSGQRNYDCYRMAYLTGRLVGAGYVSGNEAEDVLIDAATRNGVMIEREADTARTLKRGMEEGIKDPYQMIRRDDSYQGEREALGEIMQALERYHNA